MIVLERRGEVFVLSMQGPENRLGAAFVEGLESALAEVEASTGPAALVTTGAERFYSNGLDLEWLAGPDAPAAEEFLARVQRLFARLLTLAVPTVAALNGHAFAAGAMLAFAHDYRLMRADRGWLCINEIDLATGRPITRGMRALIGCRLTPRVFHEMVLTGRRYGAAEAVAEGIAHEACDENELVSRAVQRAAALAHKDRATLGALKRRLFEDVVAALEEPIAL